ncbi:hypothetical protein KSF_092510 [Reticulibacter mediterranei]|uniref:Uncharacterized protein n=1 Tax=Reticulibacter mediterranei TaxID=2778369 RepID=A0A8J3N813_9CHLR|nr:hypothetical protein [Reticulibacter mediterranei]GHO99203.1 hypothetical protein KSF_092510 [Reticulibacter mediterranei]
MSQVLQIIGTWTSQFGPVTFTGSPDHLSGHWDQKEGQGKITAGMFNPATGVLVFSYFQSWNDQHGAAAFLISATGREFHGNYVQPNGNNGAWDLIRV